MNGKKKTTTDSTSDVIFAMMHVHVIVSCRPCSRVIKPMNISIHVCSIQYLHMHCLRICHFRLSSANVGQFYRLYRESGHAERCTCSRCEEVHM